MQDVNVLKPIVLLLCTASWAQTATIILNPAAGMNAQAIQGFQDAADRWEALLFDNITVNIDVDFTVLGAGVLGGALPTTQVNTYAQVRNALIADAQTADDATATGSLPAGPALDVYINRTADSPHGIGSATPYLDNDGSLNNTSIRVSTANAKALGLLGAHNAASDADISFNSSFSWDFDPTNGITAGQFDFVGVATHEIGHALGFISGVDALDNNSPGGGGFFFPEDAFTHINPLDLFRHSAGSVGAGADLDWTADTRVKFFSLDGGATSTGVTFERGANHGGTGEQASHWRDNLGLGIFDPTGAPGELLAISANDIRALDIIGYNLNATASAALPEPGTVSLLFIGLGMMQALRKGPRRVGA